MYAVTFKPSTSGEHLFQLILNEVLQQHALPSVRVLDMLGVGARGDELSQYFVGVNAMNILSRCIKKGQRIMDVDDAARHHPMMVEFIQTILGIARKGDDLVDRFARLAIRAATVSGQRINSSTQKLVRQDREEVPCYICGSMCLRSSEDPNARVQYEHLWPSSYGGESTAENLLPSCSFCNGKKGAMLLWHTGHIFSFVLKPDPSEEELKSITRREKIARHMRTIFEVACRDSCTLKDAALAVGPVSIANIAPIERTDAVDFFNFRFA